MILSPTHWLIREYVRREYLGWARVYERAVGGHQANARWSKANPTVIRDKRYGLLRLLDLREWSDRIFYFLGRWYDLETQLVVDRIISEGMVVVDVGANYGHFTLAAAARVGPAGQVFAFEPNPSAFARLQTHIELNRLQTVLALNAGLSDHEGELELTIPRINSGEASFAGAQHEMASTVRCPVHRGDARIGAQRVHCLKIDVEGFELRVLRGLAGTIERDRPWIVMEVVQGHLARADTSPEDLSAVLVPIGYGPFRLRLIGSRGRAKSLGVVPFDPADGDGDVLWVPKERQGEIADLIRMAE